MRGHDEDMVSQAEGKSNPLAFFKNKWNAKTTFLLFLALDGRPVIVYFFLGEALFVEYEVLFL
jgi:hypothetical protein